MKNITVKKNLLRYIDNLSQARGIEYSTAHMILSKIKFDIMADRIKFTDRIGSAEKLTQEIAETDRVK